MSEIRIEVSLPLDGQFFRRQCPFCRRQFKVAISEEQLRTLTDKAVASFLLEARSTTGEMSSEELREVQFFCPYCGQQAQGDEWWTDEQVAYLQVIAHNTVAEMINRNLIKPLKDSLSRRNTGSVQIRFEGHELPQKREWIPPETDDMTEVRLPCCDRLIKVQDEWPATVFCFFCGFPHRHLSAKGGGSRCSG